MRLRRKFCKSALPYESKLSTDGHLKDISASPRFRRARKEGRDSAPCGSAISYSPRVIRIQACGFAANFVNLPSLTKASFRRAGHLQKMPHVVRHLGYGLHCAERTRFELVVQNNPYGSLANCWFQPLTHLSGSLLAKLRHLRRIAKVRIFFLFTSFFYFLLRIMGRE